MKSYTYLLLAFVIGLLPGLFLGWNLRSLFAPSWQFPQPISVQNRQDDYSRQSQSNSDTIYQSPNQNPLKDRTSEDILSIDKLQSESKLGPNATNLYRQSLPTDRQASHQKFSSPDTKQVEHNLQSIQLLLDQKQYTIILRLFDQLQFGSFQSQAESIHQEAIYQQAQSLYLNHQLQEAQSLLERHSDDYPDHARLFYLLSQIMEKKGDLPAAITALKRIHETTLETEKQRQISEQIHALREQHIAKLTDQQRWTSLLQFYEEIVYNEYSNPNNGQYFLNLARLQFFLGYQELAKASALQAMYFPHFEKPAQQLISQIDKPGQDRKDTSEDLTQTDFQKDRVDNEYGNDPGNDNIDNGISIPLKKYNNHFIVTVLINGHQKADLMIDTGATLCILSSQLAAKLSIAIDSNTRYAWFNTAGGRIREPIIQLQSLQLDRIRVDNLAASISQSISDHFTVDGLLGMSFLRHFDFTIRQDQNVLILRKKRS